MAKKIRMYAQRGEIKTCVGTFAKIEEIKVQAGIFGNDVTITFEEE